MQKSFYDLYEYTMLDKHGDGLTVLRRHILTASFHSNWDINLTSVDASRITIIYNMAKGVPKISVI